MPLVTSAQCRAARALLGWSIEELSRRANVNRNTVGRFESGDTNPHGSTLKLLRLTFERAGVEFLDNGDVRTEGRGPGVRLVKETNS